jgi:hypothetical protein
MSGVIDKKRYKLGTKSVTDKDRCNVIFYNEYILTCTHLKTHLFILFFFLKTLHLLRI